MVFIPRATTVRKLEKVNFGTPISFESLMLSASSSFLRSTGFFKDPTAFQGHRRSVMSRRTIPARGGARRCTRRGSTVIVVLWALVGGAGHPHYEALAREKDAPHRTWYIVVPYLATLAGGLTVNLWMPRAA